MNDLEAEFWRTRLEAKAAYKAWKVAEENGDGKKNAELQGNYVKAWELHQIANVAQFQFEADNS